MAVTDSGILGPDGLVRSRWWRDGAFGFRPFRWGQWQPVIPSLYWEAISPEQQIHDLFAYVASLVDYSNNQTVYIEANADDIAELQRLFAKFQASGFDDYYKEQVVAWIDAHLRYVYDHTIQQIYFALDDSGRLVAYVPEGWNDIVFSTPMSYTNQDTYGRLVLSYELATIAGYETGNEG